MNPNQFAHLIPHHHRRSIIDASERYYAGGSVYLIDGYGSPRNHIVIHEILQQRLIIYRDLVNYKPLPALRLIQPKQPPLSRIVRAGYRIAEWRCSRHIQLFHNPLFKIRRYGVFQQMRHYMRPVKLHIEHIPHHRADHTPIKRNDAIVIDMGAKYQGYCSDLTRTIFVGEPDDQFRKIYDIVLQAQLAAEDQVRAGMTGKEADAIARDIIADAGHADDFGHSLGHGVGLAVHEFPHVGPSAEEDTLQDGMVFTIEPGIYLPGWGGVRIEDIVVLENGRARVLSKAHKL